MNLTSLSLIHDAVSRRSSSWDRTGGNIDCLVDIAPGDSAVLLATDGPGKVTHIWITFMEYPGHTTVLRDLILRMTWDRSPVPAVEVPLGDFFGLGHGFPPAFYAKRRFQLTSGPLTVGMNERSLNCYFPMPFDSSAHIEIYNNGDRSLRQLYFHVDYELGVQPSNSGLFHAEFRQDKALESQDWINLSAEQNYVLMETEGQGQYVGTMFYVDCDGADWWGEGDDMVFIDRDPIPTINGTGTEDYFLNAWGYNDVFSNATFGCPLLEKRTDGGSFTSLYRFHLDDPIRFAKHIRMTMEHVWGRGAGDEAINSYASVAFWYQREPVVIRTPMPAGAANHPRIRPVGDEPIPPAIGDIDITMFEPDLRRRGFPVVTTALVGGEWLQKGALTIHSNGIPVLLSLPVPAAGVYRVELQPVYALIDLPVSVSITGEEPVQIEQGIFPHQNDSPYTLVGYATVSEGSVLLTVLSETVVPIHGIKVERVES